LYFFALEAGVLAGEILPLGVAFFFFPAPPEAFVFLVLLTVFFLELFFLDFP